jgi:hypothetical protein
VRAGLLLILVTSGAAQAGLSADCTLTGQGDVALCEGVYLRSRIAALIVPAYIVTTDGATYHHGMVWTLGVDIPKEGWSDFFSLGTTTAHGDDFPFQLGVAASFVWLPNHLIEGRLVLRARVLSLIHPNNPAISYFHLTVGAGGADGSDGPAPRIELRLRIGHIAWGGVVIVTGFQPQIDRSHFVGDLSIGLDAPWVWWW